MLPSVWSMSTCPPVRAQSSRMRLPPSPITRGSASCGITIRYEPRLTWSMPALSAASTAAGAGGAAPGGCAGDAAAVGDGAKCMLCCAG
eukprot:2980246-Prymnesium_polylepis.1